MDNSGGLVTDGEHYNILMDAVMGGPSDGLFIELGTRRGGSAKCIIDALIAAKKFNRTLICVDPYGDIPFTAHENDTGHLDYTNAMRKDTQRNLFAYVHDKPVDVHFLIMEDIEYFKRFGDGYPIYDRQKKLVNAYAMVFFDACHAYAPVMAAVNFFNARTTIGATYVFDNIDCYDHTKVEANLFAAGWRAVVRNHVKASYYKIG